MTDFANEHIKAIGIFTAVAVIAVGAFFVIKWIINKKNEQPFIILRPLPEPAPKFYTNPFTRILYTGAYADYKFYLIRADILVLCYHSDQTCPVWLKYIKKELRERGYNVSTLKLKK